MKKVLLTFDYELFFLKSGTPQKSILHPTDKLIEIFKETNTKATFFIDVLYYLRLSEENHATIEIAKMIKNQLQKLIMHGHRIELHLHPDWLNAKYNGFEWDFNNNKNYRLDSLDEKTIKNLFVTGSSILNEIACEVNNKYRVNAFRAGGYCIQPFTKIQSGFLQSGIQIDSSVLPNSFSDGIRNYDFRGEQIENKIYRFGKDPLISDTMGEFLEFPITTFRKNMIIKILDKLYKRSFRDENFGDGKGLISTKNDISIVENINKKFRTRRASLSFDDNSLFQLNLVMELLNLDYYNIICHPKFLSEKSLLNIKKFVKNTNLRFMTTNEMLTFTNQKVGK